MTCGTHTGLWRCIALPLAQLLPYPAFSRLLFSMLRAFSPPHLLWDSCPLHRGLPHHPQDSPPGTWLQSCKPGLSSKRQWGHWSFLWRGWHLLSVPSSMVGQRPWEIWLAGYHLHYLPQLVTWVKQSGQTLLSSGFSGSFCCCLCVGAPEDI